MTSWRMGMVMQKLPGNALRGLFGIVCIAACGHVSKHPGDGGGDAAGSSAGGAGGVVQGDAGKSHSGGKAATGGGSGSGSGGQSQEGGAPATGGAAAGAGGAGETELTQLTELPGCGTLALQRAPGNSAPGLLYALGSKSGVLSVIELPEAGDGKPKTLASGFVGASVFDFGYDMMVATGKTLTRVDLMTGAKTPLLTASANLSGFGVDAGSADILYTTKNSIVRVEGPGFDNPVVAAVAADAGEPQALVISYGTLVYSSRVTNNVELQQQSMHLTIAPAQDSLLFGHRSLQADDTYVYWANGTLNRAALAGDDHSVATIARPSDGSAIVAYAIDPEEKVAYFATADGSFEKSSFDSGSDAVPIAHDVPSVTSVVLDDYDVYVASECKIYKSSRLSF